MKHKIMKSINSMLTDRVLGILAVFIVFLLIIDISVELSPSQMFFVHALDGVVILVFAISYLSRLSLAESKWDFVRSGWNILDLLIIMLPIFSLLPLITGFIVYSPMLRLARVARTFRPAITAIRVAGTLPNTVIVRIPPEHSKDWRKLCEFNEASDEDLILELIKSELVKRFGKEKTAYKRIEIAADEISRNLGKDRLEEFSKQIELLAKKLVERQEG